MNAFFPTMAKGRLNLDDILYIVSYKLLKHMGNIFIIITKFSRNGKNRKSYIIKGNVKVRPRYF